MSDHIVDFGEAFPIVAHGQTWSVSWHAPDDLPDGKPHGSEGLCLAPCGRLVIISHNGEDWGFPGGRPEGKETWRETLDREVMEEACAVVTDARLLGFARSACVSGEEAGLVLVRSLWRAEVSLLEWAPRFEILFRRLAEPDDAIRQTYVAERLPLYRRVFRDALGVG